MALYAPAGVWDSPNLAYDGPSQPVYVEDEGDSSRLVAGEWNWMDNSTRYSPADLNPQASSFLDVLKFGITRAIDAHYGQAVRPANTQPRVAPVTGRYLVDPDAARAGGVPTWAWLALGGVVLYLLVK